MASGIKVDDPTSSFQRYLTRSGTIKKLRDIHVQRPRELIKHFNGTTETFRDHLEAVIAIMKLSDDYTVFLRKLDRIKQRYDVLPFYRDEMPKQGPQ